ncbi:MAG: Gfo/Idh/MocA family oxidoreductase [Verrucomicrobiia bacterium]
MKLPAEAGTPTGRRRLCAHHFQSHLTRRDFLRKATSAAGVAAFPHLIPASALGRDGAVAPSERIAIGLIGTGNINTRHREAFLVEKDARIVAVCDPITSRREAYLRRINQVAGHSGCTACCDFRELLVRDDVDAVCIGTPDHWHAPQAIAAMQAGKDVYVEKPLTYAVAEGRRVIEVAASSGRVLQTGLQRRSMPPFRYACELVRNGRIGRLTHTEVGIVGIHYATKPQQVFPTAPVPEGMDYDLWLGPAPWVPFCPERIINYYWYHILDYSRGFIPANGVHFVDIAQWAIGDEVKPVEVSTPVAVIPSGGMVDAITEWRSDVVYQNGVRMSFSSEGKPHPDGIRFVGTDGWIHINGGGAMTASRESVLTSVIGSNEVHLYSTSGPHRNFLDCIRSRRLTAASAEIGHHATTTCNLVETAGYLGRSLKWDAATERFIGDEAANRLLSQPMRSPWRV